MFWVHEAIFLIVLKLLSEAKGKSHRSLASADVFVETTSLTYTYLLEISQSIWYLDF